MSIRMAGNLMPFYRDRAKQVRVCIHILCFDKESSLDILLFQHIQKLI